MFCVCLCIFNYSRKRGHELKKGEEGNFGARKGKSKWCNNILISEMKIKIKTFRE